ncbi:MAG TPA: phosphatase PAP2 family protein [Ktedonobacteraceae bacterium]|nr:phosphatase PAP2 family protein [Ktedonobacteraceae bacterium]
MNTRTYEKGMQPPTTTTTAGGEERSGARKRHTVEAVLWVVGLIVFVIACVIMHGHPRPYPFELSLTETLQGIHFPSWLVAIFDFPSAVNQPIPSAIALAVWFFGMLIVGFVKRHRQKPAALWFLSAGFLALCVVASSAVNVGIDDLVARPRPTPSEGPIHVHDLVPFPSFPSGHTEHDIAYYGFLLYLSFTRGVREWRYRWLLIPLQLYAVYDIFSIGFSRILEGEHWLFDVLGGYLEGMLLLFIFIFLYRWATDWFAQRKARKLQMA